MWGAFFDKLGQGKFQALRNVYAYCCFSTKFAEQFRDACPHSVFLLCAIPACFFTSFACQRDSNKTDISVDLYKAKMDRGAAMLILLGILVVSTSDPSHQRTAHLY